MHCLKNEYPTVWVKVKNRVVRSRYMIVTSHEKAKKYVAPASTGSIMTCPLFVGGLVRFRRH